MDREAESRGFPEISVRQLTPGYFTVLSLSLLEGRLGLLASYASVRRALRLDPVIALRAD